MRRHREILFILTAIFLVFVVFLCGMQRQKEMLSFQISFGDNKQTITLWESKTGKYYVFLPSYAKMEQVQIVLHTGNPVSINGVKLEDGMNCMPFTDGHVYPISYTAWGSSEQGEIIFLKSDNVAAMYIDTQSGNMNYIHAAKGNKETGRLTLCQSDGTIDYSGEIVSVQGRGNYTWEAFEKKPYSINLAEEADLLNLGSARKWILLANAADPSHLRNKIVYDFADRIGLRYAPGSEWVDLYLNGEYAGLYLLSERNEVHPERVDITQTGSFLVSMEHPDRLVAQNNPYVSTAADQYLRVQYPENPSYSRLQEIEDIWQSVENAILAEDDMDPVTGKTWMEQIDLDSWVKKYLIEEIFGNVDACFISQFFYCDGNKSKIYAGPVWDYDISTGLESVWQLMEPNMLHANRYNVKEGFATPWFHALYQKDIFFERMVNIYRYEFLPLLHEYLYEHIAACSEQITDAYVLDQVRWDLGTGDIREKTEYLQNYIRKRTDFLNNIWINELPYYTVKADNANGANYGYYVFFPGEVFTGLPEFASTETNEFLGWYDAQTGEPFSSSDPIYKDITIQARWRTQPGISLGGIVKRIPPVVLLILFPGFVGIDLYRGNLLRRRK